MASDERGPAKLGRALEHPVRHRIVELLGERGPLSWKELSGDLGIGTGALYYHIDALEGIVARSEEKKYALTRQGQKVYRFILEYPSSNPDSIAGRMKPSRRTLLAREVFIPRGVVQRLALGGSAALLSSAVLGSVAVIVLILARAAPYLFYLSPSASPLWTLLGYLTTLATLVGVGTVSSLLLSRTRPAMGPLIFGGSLSIIPIAAFGVVARVFFPSGSPGVMVTPVLVFFQAWSALVFASALSVASASRIEVTMLVSLGLLYATLVVMTYAGGYL